MLVAKVINGTVADLQDYRAMFPDTSFPASGPNADFYAENNLMSVSVYKPFDAETEVLVSCAPYIEDGQVFIVTTQPKPEVVDAG